MTYTSITAENARNYPAGTKVRFNAGAMHGSVDGVVTGIRTTPFCTELMAKTECGHDRTISGFSTVGIGVYLLEVAAAPVNRKSPWYIENRVAA